MAFDTPFPSAAAAAAIESVVRRCPHRGRRSRPWWRAAALLLLAGAAQAQPAPALLAAPQPQNVLTLQAQASAEVAQDLLTITLQAVREGPDAAQVQSQLRQALEQALAEARKAQRPGQVDVHTGAFNLFPRYANKPNAAPVIAGWQGSAELVIEGRDLAAISQLAGRLSGLQVQRVQPGLSREAREKTEAEVTVQAIERFKARASLYARQFGFASYGLREINIGGSEGYVPPMVNLRGMKAMAAPMAADESQPVAPGQATVTVTVSGSIQLSPR